MDGKQKHIIIGSEALRIPVARRTDSFWGGKTASCKGAGNYLIPIIFRYLRVRSLDGPFILSNLFLFAIYLYSAVLLVVSNFGWKC